MNKFVPPFLIKKKKMPAQLPPFYQPGNESEAVVYLKDGLNSWQSTEGAIEWVKKQFALKKK